MAGYRQTESPHFPDSQRKGKPPFPKPNGKPTLSISMVKGFLKEAASIFNGLRGVKNLRSKVGNLAFVTPRQIPLIVPDGYVMQFCERPLRAMTAQGPRVGLARSEQLPAGTSFVCQLKVFDGPISEPLLRDLLSYGSDQGFGQWRNASHGRFEFKLE